MALWREGVRYGLGYFAEAVSVRAAFNEGLHLGIGGEFGGNAHAMCAAVGGFYNSFKGMFNIL